MAQLDLTKAPDSQTALMWGNWYSQPNQVRPLAIRLVPRPNKKGEIEEKQYCKTPIGSGWNDYSQSDALTYFNRIANQQTNLNVGVITGKVSNLIGVDIDHLKDDDLPGTLDGMEYYRVNIEPRLHQENIHPTMILTGSGGLHLWFAWSPRAGLLKTKSKVEVKPGVYTTIDVRNESGYLVAPPSLHRTGNYYQFLTPINQVLPERPVMPDWLIDFLDPTLAPKSTTPTGAREPSPLETWVPPAATSADQDEIAKLIDLIKLLGPHRTEMRTEWLGTLFAIVRICKEDPRGRELAHSFSSLSSKYDAEEVDKLIVYTKQREKGYGWPKLIEMAKADNPQGYQAWEAKYPLTRKKKTEKPLLLSPTVGELFLDQAGRNHENFAYVDNEWFCWKPDRLLWKNCTLNQTGSNMIPFVAAALQQHGCDDSVIASKATTTYCMRDLIPYVNQKLDLGQMPPVPSWVIPVKQGRVWDLTNDEVRDRRQEDYFNFECPVDPNAVTIPGVDRVRTFFHQLSYGNWDVAADGTVLNTTYQFQKWLTNHLLYCLSGDFNKQRPNLVNIYGLTHNGKTTTVETISEILGDFAGPLARAVLFDPAEQIRGHQAHMFTLKGKRCVVLTEPGNQAGNPSTIKTALGGDQISARNCGANQTINFRSYAKILIPSNELFNVDSGAALTDVKIVYLEFKAHFTANPINANDFQADPTLDTWLRSEEGKACFVKYLISQYEPELLPIPKCIKLFHDDVVDMSRPSADVFIDTFLTKSEGGRTGTLKRDQCHEKYGEWCQAKKLKKISLKDFGMRLRAKFGETFHTMSGNRYEAHFNTEAYDAVVPPRPTFNR